MNTFSRPAHVASDVIPFVHRILAWPGGEGLPVLRALLHGDLHASVEDRRLFIVKEKGGAFELIDTLSGEVTVTPSKDGLKRSSITN